MSHETSLTAQENTGIATLANIEYRIAYHIHETYRQGLEVGRCLIEAKEGGLIAHGEWEAWVRRHTGMGERQAQKLMQAARSVSPGSIMEQLPISKIQLILSLPKPEREEVAQQAVADDLTVEKLRREVERRKQLEAELKTAQQEIKGRRSLEARAAQEHTAEIERLKAELARQPVGDGMSPEAQTEIDRLRGELEEAETYAEKQAELRQATQRELLEAKAQAARGDVLRGASEGGLSAQDVAAAVRAFVGTAGMLPHMGAVLAGISEAERQQLRQSVDAIAAWVDGSRKAMQHVEAAYEIE